MLGESIEAVFENGIFRPLQPVALPEKQRVTVLLPPNAEDLDEPVEYKPVPFSEVKTIRVRIRRVADFGPLPYPVEPEDVGDE